MKQLRTSFSLFLYIIIMQFSHSKIIFLTVSLDGDLHDFPFNPYGELEPQAIDLIATRSEFSNMICGNDDSDKNGCFVGMLVGEMLGMMEKRVYELAEISMNIDASDTNNTRLETLYLASNELNRMLENPTLQNKEKGTQEVRLDKGQRARRRAAQCHN